MALNAANKTGGGDFVEQEILEEGSYKARVVQIIELGMQPQRPYKGKVKPPVEELYITYELNDEFMVDENGEEIEDKPRWMSEGFPFYGLGAENARCNKRLKAIDPKNKTKGDWAKLGGAPCNVTFSHNVKGDKTYVNVSAVTPIREKDKKGMAPLVNDVKVFDIDEPDMEIFEALPTWLQDKIKGNLNFIGSALDIAINGEASKPEEPEEEEQEEEEKPEAKKKAAKKKAAPKDEPEEEAGEDQEEDEVDENDIPW